MKVGDRVVVVHDNLADPGVAGYIGVVVETMGGLPLSSYVRIKYDVQSAKTDWFEVRDLELLPP